MSAMSQLKDEERFFIGVSAPESVAARVHEFRLWVGQHYGCKSGFQTPPHVTLVPPFFAAGPETLDEIEKSLGEFSMTMRGFKTRLEGFDAFGDRTVFISPVSDPAWEAAHRAIYQKLGHDMPGLIQPDKRPFRPHMTIANRDIPAGTSGEMLSYLRSVGMSVEFPVDNISLYEFINGVWRERCRWPLT